MAFTVQGPQKKLIVVLAVLAILILWAVAVGHSGGTTVCPVQDELKSFLSEKAAGIKQWNSFKEIYSFEVEGYQKKSGSYTISFNQGYVNCVKEGTTGFKCDRRDPIFSIYSDHSGGGGGVVLEAREIMIDQASFEVVGRIMCTKGG